MATKVITAQNQNGQAEITVSDDSGEVVWQNVTYDHEGNIKQIRNETGYVCDYFSFNNYRIAIDNTGVFEIADATTLNTLFEEKYHCEHPLEEVIIGETLEEVVDNFTFAFDILDVKYDVKGEQ